MKDSNTIRQLIAAKNAELQLIDDAIRTENRSMTDAEKVTYNDGISALDGLNADLETAERNETIRAKAAAAVSGANENQNRDAIIPAIGIQNESSEDKKLRKRFSIQKAINEGLTGRLTGAEKELTQEGGIEMARLGFASTGIVIPSMIANRATVVEGPGTGLAVAPWEKPLHENMSISDWVTKFTGITDYSIPVMGDVTLNWEGETDATADSGAVSTKKDLTPKRISGYVDVSKQTSLQTNASVDAVIEEGIRDAVSEAVMRAMFTAVGGSAPTELRNGLTAVEKNAINNLIFALIEQLMTNKAYKGKLGFVCAASLFTEVMTSPAISGVTALMNQRIVGGHEMRFSANVEDPDTAKEGVYFADWSKVHLAQFGGLELTFDNITQAGSGKNRIVLNAFYDFALVKPNALVVGQFGGTNDA